MEQELWPGWQTVRLIGMGSFASVYEIKRENEGKQEFSALKVISVSARDDRKIFGFVRDSAYPESVAKQLEHTLRDMIREYYLMWEMRGNSNIVSCEDMRYIRHKDGAGWDVYIKMELLQPLEKTLEFPCSEEKLLKIGIDMCRALVECGKKKIIHRDIKPPNIFLCQETGNYKLGDFGIARVAKNVIGDSVSGTYDYMAPEVYNHQPYDCRADIYSLGMVLYYLLNHRTKPFLSLSQDTYTEEQKTEAFHRRMSGEKLPLPADGSPALQKVTMKALEFLPEKRYLDPDTMLADLRDILRERTTGNGGGRSVDLAPSPSKCFGKAAILSIVSILTAAVLLGTLMVWSAGQKASVSESIRTEQDSEFAEKETTKYIRVLDGKKLRPGEGDAAGAYYSVHTLDSIVFLASAGDAPAWSWDVSQAGEDGVLAWTEQSQKGKTILYVAANGGVVAPQNCSRLFEGFEWLTSIDLNNLDTSEVTDMSGMFASCVSLREVKMEALDTSRVKNMGGMFYGCIRLEQLNLSRWDTSAVTDMSFLFGGASSLRRLDLSGLDTSGVQDMSSMFLGCESLEKLDLSDFDTGSAENMEGMFSLCRSLKELDLTSFSLKSVKDISMMFADSQNLQEIHLAGTQFPPGISASGVLKNCPAQILWQTNPG